MLIPRFYHKSKGHPTTFVNPNHGRLGPRHAHVKLPTLILIVVTASAGAQVIPGFQISENEPGYTGVYVPFDGDGTPGGAHYKAEYIAKVLNVWKPKVIRRMDTWTIVDNATTNWATRSANDFGPKAMTYESTINLDNTALSINPNYRPWLNLPFLADDDHDFRLGQLYAQQYHGKKVIVSNGNEGWNIFGTNIPAQNLFAARTEEPGKPDFEASGRRWGRELGKSVKAFTLGFVAGGGNADNVQMEIEGFAPATAWAQYQIDGMKAVGINPATYHAHVAIAQYAAGSDGDLQGPTGTPDEKRAAVLNFINSGNGPLGWTNAHRALARANGLADLVDAYEARLGIQGTSSTQDWRDFQLTDQQRDVQERGINILVGAMGGPDVVWCEEGFVGFPWDHGVFNLADWPGQFDNPAASMAWTGALNTVDRSVPEPAAFLLIGASVLAMRRRAA